jgi:signal transduction histidine kinase
MAQLLEELLDGASLEAGQTLELRRAPTDLVALARQVTADQQRTTTQHVLRCESAEPSLVGEWDAARLERVLANLLSNAIKYAPGGGDVVVTVARDPSGPGAGWAVLAVRDRGLGIPPEDLPHVFEHFYRASNVVGRIRGSGIGLWGVRQIVAQHGGTIGVESTPGVGSTFTVRLPL